MRKKVPDSTSKTKNSLTAPKTKPAVNDRTRLAVKSKEKEKVIVTAKSSEKGRAGNEGEKRTKEFSRIRSKTWEKEEFEARKNVEKKNSKDAKERTAKKSEDVDVKRKSGESEYEKEKSDESMKNEKITVSDQRERKECDGKEDGSLPKNENAEEMNNREQIDADGDSQEDKYSDDFEDYDSDFEEDESERSKAGNESVTNLVAGEGEEDKLSVVGYEKKNIFSRERGDEDWKGGDGASQKKKIAEEKEEPYTRRTDFKWRENDLQKVNPNVDSSRIKRINDLSQLVRLTGVTYHVYDSPPLNYELFIKLFGRKHTKQVETQTKETTEIYCQTDASSLKEKMCQFPNYISNLESEDCIESWKERGKLHCDPFKLRIFLSKAEQVINVSLERRFTSGSARSKSAKRLLKVPASVQGLCTQFYKLIPPSFSAAKLEVLNMTYDSSYLISCQTTHPAGEEREESFISLWSLKNTENEHLFRTRSVVTCLVSDNRHTIYAGSSDGSITLWDIRESANSFPPSFQSTTENAAVKSCRGPSFSTACSLIPVTHSHPVTGLSLFKRNDEHSNCSPRLCSVDEEGLIILWMFQDSLPSTCLSSSSSSPSSLSSDILVDGMFPGSRIKLIQETSIRLPGNEFSIKTMVTSSYDPFTLFLGTTSGQVIRVSKFSQQNEPPQVYYEQGEESFSGVTCITFNPKMLTHFLVSFEDGTICLFCEHKNQPLVTWDPSDLQISNVISVQWFPGIGDSFAALASSSTIIIWNLSLNVTNPSSKFQMTRYNAGLIFLLHFSIPFLIHPATFLRTFFFHGHPFDITISFTQVIQEPYKK